MFQECRHIKPSGGKCHAAALRGQPYCYYHIRAHQSVSRAAAPSAPYESKELNMPFLEDRGAIQIALSEVVSALAGHRIEFKRAALIIYALQVASSNAKNSQELIADQQVRDRSETEEGDELAPEVITYEKDDAEYQAGEVNEDELSLREYLVHQMKKIHARNQAEKAAADPAAVEEPDEFDLLSSLPADL